VPDDDASTSTWARIIGQQAYPVDIEVAQHRRERGVSCERLGPKAQ
jgi:hypothetical protein